MRFSSCLKVRRAAPRRVRASSHRPLLEILEDRLVPSLADGTILLLDNPSGPGGPPPALVGVNPRTGAQTVVSTGQLFSTPVDPREAPDQQIYVTDYSAYGTGLAPNVGGAVFRIDPNTGHQSLVAKGGYISGPSGLAVIQLNPVAPPQLYITDVGDDTGSYRNIVQIDPATGTQHLISSGGILFNPLAIVPGPGHNIYVCDEHAFGTGAIDEINLDSGHQRVISTGGVLRYPVDMAEDASGNLIVFNRDSATDFTVGAGSVLRINPHTGAQTIISSNGDLISLDGGTVARDGTIYAGTTTTVPPTVPAWVVAVDPVKGTQHIVSEGGQLDIIEGMTVFYTHPGGEASLPQDSPPVLLVGPVDSVNVSPALGATAAHTASVAGVPQTVPLQRFTPPAALGVLGEHGSQGAAGHRAAPTPMAVDALFADWGSQIL